MSSKNKHTSAYLVLSLMALSLVSTLAAKAQVQTQTSSQQGTPTTQVNVQRGEVVYVAGNELVVRMENGTLRHFPNVPETARVMVGGKELGIHDLKPGMKLERTVTVTHIPTVVTTVKTLTGQVWYVNPPSSVILRLQDGKQQQFKIPNGQKFIVDGQQVDAWGLKKGMTVTATKVEEMPVDVYERNQQLTGTMPPPPPAPPVDAPLLIAIVTPPPPPVAPAPAPEQAQAPAQLPKTGSMLPLIGLFSLLSLVSSIGLRLYRNTL